MSFWKPSIVTLSILFTSVMSFGGVMEGVKSLGLSAINCKVTKQGIFNANGTWKNTDERTESNNLVIASNSKEAAQIILNKLVLFKIKTDQEYFVGQDENRAIFAIADILCK